MHVSPRNVENDHLSSASKDYRSGRRILIRRTTNDQEFLLKIIAVYVRHTFE